MRRIAVLASFTLLVFAALSANAATPWFRTASRRAK
jgi:hypothetical protein